MTIEEILAGESKNVEFKENLPEKSIKYMKSVVAFANGTGGKIIFGIADKTREVIGFDKEDVFKKMDAIANAVTDSCEPAIIPDITLQTVDGKTVIVAEISEGRQRPYYIKALGRQQFRPWGVLIERDGKDYPANAYAILAGCGGLHVAIQCGVFNIIIEHWGSGIPGIIGKVKKAGLREPEFLGGEVDLRINIYRGQINDNSDRGSDLNDLNDPNSAEKVPDNTSKMPDSADKMPNNTIKMPDSEQERLIYKYVLENGSITTNKVMELLNVKQRRARVILQSMIEKDWLKKTGAARSTIYLKNMEGR